MIEIAAEPGAFQPGSDVAKYMSREELSQTAESRVKFLKEEGGSSEVKLRNEALVQVARGWLRASSSILRRANSP